MIHQLIAHWGFRVNIIRAYFKHILYDFNIPLCNNNDKHG